MSDAWPEPAVNAVQAIADTKLLLGHRYAQWSLAGPSLEDDIGGASAAQEEVGHVRQLYRLLEQQGREAGWLHGDREPDAFANAASLDRVGDDWVEHLAAAGPADRAAWLLLDAIDHGDFRGLVDKMGEDEYFHLEYQDARLATVAEDQPEAVVAALEATLPGTLAFIGSASHDDDADPLVQAGFTGRSVAAIRTAFEDHYRSLLAGTPVSLDGVDWQVPALDAWNETRRRENGGGISDADVEMLRGSHNAVFVVQ